MNNTELREYLKKHTNMTKYDIDRHIKDGIFVYTNDTEGLKEFLQDWIAALCDEEDVADAWQKMYIVGEYRMDFVL